MPDLPDMPCRELVEVITDYLEDALPYRDRLRFEAHLAECGACREYVAQFEQTIALTGRIEAEQLSPVLRDELLSAFRRGQLVARFAEAGIPEVRASYGAVLMPLFQQDDLRVGDLASRAGLSKQSLTGILRECETAGLVERRRDPDDGRAFRVRLTRRGRRFQRVAESVLRDVDAEVVAPLGPSDRDAVIAALKGLIDL